MTPALTGLMVTDGSVWATLPDGEPAIVARTSEAGSVAVLLNTRMEWLAKGAVGPDTVPTVSAVVAYLCRRFDITPPVRVEGSTTAVAEEFTCGQARYYGLLLGRNAGETTVTLSGRGHTYDVRRGKYLGNVESFTDVLDPRRHAEVYAQLPYAVTDMTVTVSRETRDGEDTAAVRGNLEADDEVTECHVIHCEVMDPDAHRPRYHVANISAPNGRFEILVPLALNHAKGKWQVELTDVATGTKKTVAF